MRKVAGALLAVLLLMSACASEGEAPPAGPGGNEPPGFDSEANNDKDKSKNKTGSDKKQRKGSGSKERTNGDEATGGASAGSNDAEGGEGSKDRDEGGSTNGGSGTQGPSPYPAAGSYSFAQSGYEEFCDSAGRCDKEQLPARQPMKLSYESRSGSSAVVVSEQEASGSRVARTWTKFTPSGAHITKLYVRFVYSGFRFERTYVPEPAVESLRFPFTAGERWSGKWKASTSGSYSVRVGSRSPMTVGGRTITVYPVDTTTEFRGDFEGKSTITTYFDADTKAVVAADGVLNVTSQFGRYTTVFETKLASGPGY